MAKKKEQIIEEINSHEIILQNEIEDVLSTGFGRYSKYVLQERAVPDARDGLKPVQRRIIYTMYLEGNFSSKPTRKCARTVGAVIGRFHPHGDTSVYEAMVRLSQDWKMRIPLLDFQGNNGSIDGDGPAAYRYTEARLSEIADEMIRDINKNTVDMELNFDDQELEPAVLPSRFPNLLVNGSQGVAVGASTDIPPHNLEEVIDAINYRLSHKRVDVKDLLTFIKGPDFPTGGIIINPDDLPKIYETGKGLIRLRCRYDDTSEKNAIIITEIPYGMEKSSLVQAIAKLRVQYNIDAINDVRDETDKDGLRIVIEIKDGASVKETLKFIISKGILTSSIKFNLLVIDHNRPRTLNLLEAIDCYIDHQVEVITRRSNFDLNKYRDRLHIVDGLIKALSILDDVVHTIRHSHDKADARKQLVDKFAFTEKQAEALLNLQLYRLSNTDVTTLINEKKDLEKKIADLVDLLSSEEKIKKLIANDLKTIKNKFPIKRLTDFASQEEFDGKIDFKALVTKEETMVSFTRDGYLKRTSFRSYNKDVLPGMKDGDVLRGLVKCNTIDTLILFTSQGNYLSIPVFKLQELKWKDEGKHVNDIGALGNNERIIGGFVVTNDFKDGVYACLLSKNGQIKRTPINEFITSRIAKTAKAFNLSKDDELIKMVVTNGDNNLLVIASDGTTSLFNENDLTPLSAKASGVKAIARLSSDAYLVSLIALSKNEKVPLYVIAVEQSGIVVSSDKLTLSARMGIRDNLFTVFKSNPVRCLTVIKGNNQPSFDVVLTNKLRDKIDIRDFKNQPLNMKLREHTLNLSSTDNIKDVSLTDVTVIDEDFKVLKVKNYLEKPLEAPKKKEKKEQDYSNMSLFDFVDDD